MKKCIPLFISIISLATVSAYAQKLPEIQESSLRATANLKVDGKATEWGDKFQAYSKNTAVFYTISNDDAMLYLAVKASDQYIIHKILHGGITLSINGSGKMKDKDGMSVTFPEYGKKEPPIIINLAIKTTPTNDAAKNTAQADSFMNARNKLLTNKFKTIGVANLKTITDSTLSIYNEEGIKAMALLDNEMQYTYELSVPLKYLALSTARTTKFTYNIKLNGMALNGGGNIIEVRPGYFSYSGRDGVNYTMGGGEQFRSIVYPTDFWGEYTLSKNL